MSPPHAAPRHALLVGTSDGIGLALARRLLALGWSVTGVSRRASPVEDPRYLHAVLDVRALEYRASLRALLAGRAPLDVCVYCAGVGELFDPTDLGPDADTARVNLVGAMDTAAEVLPAMVARGRGHFVGLSSIGDGLSPEAPAYAASKAGLSAYLESLALALRPRGVAVTNVRFGFVDTKMAKSPVQPLKSSTERAVDVLLRCLAKRPVRCTYPRAMGGLVGLLQRWLRARVWLSS